MGLPSGWLLPSIPAPMPRTCRMRRLPKPTPKQLRPFPFSFSRYSGLTRASAAYPATHHKFNGYRRKADDADVDLGWPPKLVSRWGQAQPRGGARSQCPYWSRSEHPLACAHLTLHGHGKGTRILAPSRSTDLARGAGASKPTVSQRDA